LQLSYVLHYVQLFFLLLFSPVVTMAVYVVITIEEHHAALLFIGHALIGCQAATCRLDGISAVTDAFLNNDKLQCLSAVRFLLISCLVHYNGCTQ